MAGSIVSSELVFGAWEALNKGRKASALDQTLILTALYCLGGWLPFSKLSSTAQVTVASGCNAESLANLAVMQIGWMVIGRGEWF